MWLVSFLIGYISNCKIRLYHRDLYLGLLPDRDSHPTMVNYEVCQKFETEFVDVYSSESIIRVKQTTNYCLDVAHDRDKALVYWSKHGGVNQRWIIVHGPLGSVKLKNENLCLEYLPDEDMMRMQNCSESENQLYNLVEDEDEDHGLATHVNVTLRHDLDGNFVSGHLKNSHEYMVGDWDSWHGGNDGMHGTNSYGAGHQVNGYYDVGVNNGRAEASSMMGHVDLGHGNLRAGTIGHGAGINGGGAYGMGIHGWGNHHMGHHKQNQAYYDHGHDSYSPYLH